MSATATIASLTDIPQGDTDNARDGDALKLKSLMCVFNVNANTGAVRNIIRIIIFQWKPNDSTAPTAGQLLLTGASGSVDTTSQYSHDNRQLFNILSDWYFPVGGSTTVPDTVQVRTFKRKIFGRKMRKNVQFSAAGTTGTNKLYILYIADTVANNPVINGTFLTRFTDS